ncbi:MAG: 2,3-bisphosphoglycerate-independent phosphoglycerate mutase [Candidatus Pacebacteria bacterium]|nr:2,3-bisphosphoglycerate-independent phosphoglycerate mutase [Candidatus Paceibacterota bacterium]
MDFEGIEKLVEPADTKMVLLVMDGLGGLPAGPRNLTELEAAHTPNLDALAASGICGLHEPVGPGITPGSGPAHLGVFGYDPVKYQVGRGVLAALGVDYPLTERDVAARGNFCTIDDSGLVTDRRAGRISTETNEEMCELLRRIEVPGVEINLQPVKEHRFLIVLSGDGLSGALADTDPQDVGHAPLKARALADSPEAKKTVDIVQQFQDQAKEVLADQHPANMVLLRGFAQFPKWPQFPQCFGVKAAAIASYPMYRGVAKLIGMEALEAGMKISDEVDVLRQRWNDYDFFYVHVKKIDSAGEDGDYDRKIEVIEETDRIIPDILALKPDVIVVTGDHSTPSVMAAHSWHPVPVLLAGNNCRPDEVTTFGERACLRGALGPRMPAADLMPLALAHAGRLEKFGA